MDSSKEVSNTNTQQELLCPSSGNNKNECKDTDNGTARKPMEQVHEKPGTSNVKLDSTTEEEFGYDSEPACVKSYENRRRKKFSLKKSQGKTMYPVKYDRELRELTRKHLKLEKNLKIDGLPEPPKMRKRRLSTSAMGRDKDNILQKRRKLLASERPKKGHLPNWDKLGGNATDPLNLNGLATSEEGRLLNLKTPENSPLPTPDFRKIVFVKIPPNIEDPLNLEGKHDQSYLDMLLKSTRKKKHRAKKNKDHNNPTQSKDTKPDGDKATVDNSNSSNADVTVTNGFNQTNQSSPSQSSSQTSMLPPPKPNDEPSTPVKQGASANRPRGKAHNVSPGVKFKRQLSGNRGNRSYVDEPKKFPERPMFTHGNYNRYYGYRNRDHEPDPRLRYLNPRLFENKDVLDIGCNVGHVTLAIAKHFHPRKILGMDIDGKLIRAARQNMRHLLSQSGKSFSKFPSVFEMTRGPLEAHPLIGSSNAFPNNILFLQGNYVPVSEDILSLQKEEYDTILALSITKWIHLNNGDHGMKLFFQKIVKQLRPGGHLILEPQPFASYRKRAKLTPDMFKNYSGIKLKPEGFKNYLLSIGFGKCEVIAVPVAKAKGFRRPLILFTKTNRSTPPESEPPMLSQNYCTECAEGAQSECDHIQFTGMRRGAYADRLYDHIAYPSNRMSENNSGQYPGSSAMKPYTIASPIAQAFVTYCPMNNDTVPQCASVTSPVNPITLSSSSTVSAPPVGGSGAAAFPSSVNGVRGGNHHRTDSDLQNSSSSRLGGSRLNSSSSSSSSSSSTSCSSSSSSTSQSSSERDGSSSSSYSELSSPLVNGMINDSNISQGGQGLAADSNNTGNGAAAAQNLMPNGDLNNELAAAEEIVWVNNNGDVFSSDSGSEDEQEVAPLVVPAPPENGGSPSHPE